MSSDIEGFYRGLGVFITGATGFLGKGLVEKLLRCLPNGGPIYLLVRPKRGKEIQQRLQEFTKNKVFDLIREKNPDCFSRLVAVAGDIGEEGLGLNSNDLNKLINNVSIVFHCAATLDFETPLKEAVMINLVGTKSVVALCQKMSKFKALIHVSSAYVNCLKFETHEVLYPVEVDPESVISQTLIDDNNDEKTLQELTKRLLGKHPNTYTYTKLLAEHVISDSKISTAIIRPSMITCAWREPEPGWISSSNGPSGFIQGAAKGVLRRIPVSLELVYDYIPVDIVINQMIFSAWHVANTKPIEVLIYHCTSSTQNPFQWKTVVDHIKPLVYEFPLKSAVWYPNLIFLSSLAKFKISAIFFHFFPAVILDIMLRLTGNKPILFRIHKKISHALECLEFFIFNEWKFHNENTRNLAKLISPRDQRRRLFFLLVGVHEVCAQQNNVIYLLRRYIKNADFVNKMERIPGPVKWPFFGCIPAIIEGRKDPPTFMLNVIPKRYGRYVRVWVFDKAQVLMTSARGLETILKNPAFNDKTDEYDLLRESMGEGLITANDPLWSKHHKLLAPTISTPMLREYLPIFAKCSKVLCNNLLRAQQKSDENGFDIFPFFSPCTLDMMTEAMMGVEINSQNDENENYTEQMNRSNDVLLERYSNLFLHIKPIYYFSKTKKEQDELIRKGQQFCNMVITKRREIFEKDPKFQNMKPGAKLRLPLLDTMFIAEKEGILNKVEILHEVSNFLSAGLDSVSSSSAYTFYLLGIYPEIQERVVAELEEVFGDSGRIPDMNDLSRLKYLERVIKESLRVYPTAGVFERKIKQDVQCEQYLIPAGCKITAIPFLVHRDPEFWPEPEKFDPDRFLPENSQGRNPCSWIPFSFGPRMCAGYKFGLAEEKVILSTVLRKCRIESLVPREKFKMVFSLALRPVDGIPMKFYVREDKPKLCVNDIM